MKGSFLFTGWLLRFEVWGDSQASLIHDARFFRESALASTYSHFQILERESLCYGLSLQGE